jgi:hypothetical protein
MSVSSITERVATLTLKPATSITASVQPANVPSQARDKGAIETAQPLPTNSKAIAKAQPAAKQSALAAGTQIKVVRHMSHVVEVYNPQGKKRLKFMDSSNNVIYQFPSEMAAKVEDLMMKSDTSTDKKG